MTALISKVCILCASLHYSARERVKIGMLDVYPSSYILSKRARVPLCRICSRLNDNINGGSVCYEREVGSIFNL